MADSACLVHGFSYASAIPNESKQGNPMHVLGESISFGRFMNESLSWEKWSTFSHKKYVEEAERYSQPGSVAQKKAFFEAHYKRIAAQKAAALLEQEDGAKAEAEEVKIEDAKEDHVVEMAAEDSRDIQVDNGENKDRVSVPESSGVSQKERPLLEKFALNEDIPSATSQSGSNLSPSKTSIQKTWRVPSAPAKQVAPHLYKGNYASQSTIKPTVDSLGKKKSSSKSLQTLMNLVPVNEPDREPVSPTKKIESFTTSLRTPHLVSAKGAPATENTRTEAPSDLSGQGSKRTSPKWHILSAVCSKSITVGQKKLRSPTPSVQRTEERAAKRKQSQKPEEKSNACEVEKMQLQKTLQKKAGKEFRNLGCHFCFKARPLPEFFKEKEMPKEQIKKEPAAQTQTAVLGRGISNKKQGTVSVPPPPPMYLAKNSGFTDLSKKNVLKPSKFLASSTPERNMHENASPNIQQ